MRLCLLFLIAVVGCGPSTIPTVSLAGTVTLDGVPLKEGIIILYSDVPGQSTVSATIQDGKFEAPVVPVGQYKAAFRSQTMQSVNEPVDSNFAAPTKAAKPDPIPAKYREASVPFDATVSNSSIKIELTSK